MSNDKIQLPLEIYAHHLKIINGVGFTPREIDIIACILNGRSAKTMPSFLSISPKTVATHMGNIRGKAGCSSRESIIDFIENSDKLSLIKNDYYSSLLTQISFEKSLEKFSEIELSQSPVVHLLYRSEKKEKLFIIHYIEAPLILEPFLYDLYHSAFHISQGISGVSLWHLYNHPCLCKGHLSMKMFS